MREWFGDFTKTFVISTALTIVPTAGMLIYTATYFAAFAISGEWPSWGFDRVVLGCMALAVPGAIGVWICHVTDHCERSW